MKRHPARPKNSVVKNPRGYRMHLQIEEAKSLVNMIVEWIRKPSTQNQVPQNMVVVCSVTEVLARLNKLVSNPLRDDLNIQISHAQFYALHCALEFDLEPTNTWEDVVFKNLFMSLDRLTA